MSTLDKVIQEIRYMLDWQPKVSPRCAYRLHPEDWEQLDKEMNERLRMTGDEQSFVTKLFVIGVQVFADDTTPRLDDA